MSRVPLSKCCGDVAIVCGPSPDFEGDTSCTVKIGTCFYRCALCGDPCDIKADKSIDAPPRDKMVRRAKRTK
jgi:hypothetical protein